MASQPSPAPTLFGSQRPSLQGASYKTDSFIEGELQSPRLDFPNTLCGKLLGQKLEELINKHGEQHVLKVLEENEHLF